MYLSLSGLRPLRAYYCKALSGESNYNICINSDLTVSCNCGDYDASGHIGNLAEDTLGDIFEGEIAQAFRDDLAVGKLPISSCTACVELTSSTRKLAKEKSKNWKLPRKGIMVENTVVCNYQCLACDRGVVDTRKRNNGRSGGRLMSADDLEIVARTIQKYGIEQIFYHNLGEPFLSKNILQEMEIIRKFNPDTRIIISTNGTFVEGDTKLRAAMLFDEIHVSIDGSNQQTLEKYQIGGDFERSFRNMESMVRYRDERFLTKPLIEWKYVVFKWNDSEEDIIQAIELAKKANVDRISFCKGGMPEGKGESRRYVVSSFFNNLGHESWQGRELVLREYVGTQEKEEEKVE